MIIAPETTLRLIQYDAKYYDQLMALMHTCYADIIPPVFTRADMDLIYELYPQGQMLILDGELVVAGIISRIVPFKIYGIAHTEQRVLNPNVYEQDAIDGDSIYCLELVTNPVYAQYKVGKRLSDALHEAADSDNFCCMMGTSRLPNYAQHCHELSLEDYIAKVKARELSDHVLSFHFRNKASVIGIMPNFSPFDKHSNGAAAIVRFENPSYNPNLPMNKPAHLMVGELV